MIIGRVTVGIVFWSTKCEGFCLIWHLDRLYSLLFLPASMILKSKNFLLFVHLQDDFSGCRSMSNCRCNQECLSHKVSRNDLCPELLLWNIAEGCFYCWSSVCGCDNDSQCLLLHVLFKSYWYSSSPQSKSCKLNCWNDWVCIVLTN